MPALRALKVRLKPQAAARTRGSSVSGLVLSASSVVARAGLAAEQKAEQLQHLIHPHGLAPVVGDDAREALAEDALGAEAVPAAEAARPQMQADGYPVPRQISHRAGVVVVNSC